MDIRDFVVAFFESRDASVLSENGRLIVHLPDDLKEAFGKPKLDLVFNSRDIDEDSELVTHGGYVLSKIHGLLQGKGQKVVSALSERFPFDAPSIRKQIVVKRGSVSAFKGKRLNSVDILFNFKITYLSDEKIEEMHSVVIDKYGNIFQPYDYYHSEDIVPKTEKKSGKVTRKYIENSFRECARHVSEYAKTEGARHKNEILQRLHKNISRLKGYYEAQIEEISPTNPQYEQKRALHVGEYEKKLAEEIENHGMKIVLSLVSYQIIERTDIECRLEITGEVAGKRRKTPYTHTALFDPYSGTFDLGLCAACSAPASELVVTDGNALACSHCAYACSSCLSTYSRFRINPSACKTCGSEMCEGCAARCFDCGQPVCPEHSKVCGVGQEVICGDCASHCQVCEKELCEDHSFICSSTGDRICFEHKFICKTCRRVFSQSFIKTKRKKALEDNLCPACSRQQSHAGTRR